MTRSESPKVSLSRNHKDAGLAAFRWSGRSSAVLLIIAVIWPGFFMGASGCCIRSSAV